MPVSPATLLYGAAEMGMEIEQYFSKGENFAEGQLCLLDKFGHDFAFSFPHVVEDISARRSAEA